jgi:hypothetical protein
MQHASPWPFLTGGRFDGAGLWRVVMLLGCSDWARRPGPWLTSTFWVVVLLTHRPPLAIRSTY